MTVTAAVHAQMLVVAECKCSEIGDGYGDGIHRMAAGAFVELRSAGIVLVMTGTTRFALLHFSHRCGSVVFSDNVINCIVAGRAIAVEVPEMVFMFEGNFSCIFC